MLRRSRRALNCKNAQRKHGNRLSQRFSHRTFTIYAEIINSVHHVGKGPRMLAIGGRTIHVLFGYTGISGQSARVEGNALALRTVRLVHHYSLCKGHLPCALPYLHGRSTGNVRNIEYQSRPSFWRCLIVLPSTSASSEYRSVRGGCHEMESPNRDIIESRSCALAARIVRSATHE